MKVINSISIFTLIIFLNSSNYVRLECTEGCRMCHIDYPGSCNGCYDSYYYLNGNCILCSEHCKICATTALCGTCED